MKNERKNMTNKKYPKGYHFYVIEDEKMYKIGYKRFNKKIKYIQYWKSK